MAVHLDYPNLLATQRGEVLISGTITIGASGAISSQDGSRTIFVKTSAKTGRYTGTLDRKYKKVRMLGGPGLVGDTDSAFGNTNANTAQYRNVTTSAFDIQCFLASSGADTNPASGTVIHWAAVVSKL
jgi:hypothetical protein